MQLNFTQKNIGLLLKKGLVVFCLGLCGMINAQTLSTASGTNYNGNFSIANPAPLSVSFIIENTTAAAVALTDLSCQLGEFTGVTPPGTPTVTKLFVSTTSLSGNYDISTAAWTQIATGAAIVPAVPVGTDAPIVPVITGINFIIPAGAQYRFVIEASRGLRFSFTPVPTPNTFSSGGLVLKTGNFQIAGQDIGWAGVSPVPAAGNHPIFFGGTATLVSSVPCSGTPAPGNTLISLPTATVCSGLNFTLTVANPTAGSGVGYQWQSSNTAGGPYMDIPGATLSSFTTSQTAATYYRAVVRCGTNTGTSNELRVLLTPTASCYCPPTYGDGCALGDFISNVTLLTLNNNSTCSNPPFTYYSALPDPILIRGATYPLSVSVGPDTFGQFVGVWADWNRDGDFADPGEFLSTPPVNAGANGTVIINITVPPTATLGTTRIRIRGGDDLAPTAGQSCGASNSSFGEAEDYDIEIAPCVQGVFTLQPVNTSVQCSGNMSFAVTATGSALTYSWEYRVNATSPWLTVTNSAVYSGATTPTLVLLNVPASMSGYQYRALIQGPCTAIDFSSTATLTVTPLVATVSPTAATICTGSIQQLTLTNPTSTPIYGAPSGLPAAIPDANVTGINSTINVSNVPVGAVVTNITVALNITHPWVSDLEIVLQGPGGNRINLSDLVSGTNQSGANFVNTRFSSATGLPPVSSGTAPGYTGIFRADAIPGPTGAFGVPAGPTGFLPNTTTWTPFITGALNGNWTIAMYDAGAPDAGTLTGWSVNITYVAPPAQGVWTASPAAPNTMFTDPAATVAYVAGSPANTIYVRPTVNTSYSVVYSTTTPCVSGPTVIPVTVVNPLSAVVNPSNTAACVGSNAVFTASATGGPVAYRWEVSSDGGATWSTVSGATTGTLTVSGVTALMNNYRYRAVLSAAPCPGSVTTTAATLTVNPLPTVTLSAPDVTLTPGQTTTLTTTTSPAAGANGISYTLDGATIPGAVTSTQVVGIDGFGVYQARVRDVNGCVNLSNTVTISGEASDRLWIYPNPSPGAFQVRLFYNGAISERRSVSIYTSTGQLISEREFLLDDQSSPYMRMDFDLGRLTAGTYVVKVHNKATDKIVSGLLIVQR